jgi:hypothetical protein
MMHGHEKSDLALVAVKPTNKAERFAAELVERRAEAKGNARHQACFGHCAGFSMSQAMAACVSSCL